ncbi:tripartite tricarboxylate transporter TctB family protein [Arthrobacter sp. U41]|uniref:tripartite tricarboxylate transporter TctB family protein n=1 Tax=Arthrobacter sp. U41 TaxID=1849032 RepID=UPI0011A35FEE|nr:tripartite tricarboxylate transporter TctB family protein [Arthrobacter sp. U41]
MLSAIQRFVPNAVIIALGIGAAAMGAGYGVLGDDGRVGPGFLPTVAGALMAFFAAVNVLTSGRKQTPTLDSVVEEQVPGFHDGEASLDPAGDGGLDIHGRTQRQRDRMLWTVIGIVLATVALVPLLGFMLAFAAMLLVIAVVVERRKIMPSVMVSVVTLAATYAIFVLFLRVPLPQGILGI